MERRNIMKICKCGNEGRVVRGKHVAECASCHSKYNVAWEKAYRKAHPKVKVPIPPEIVAARRERRLKRGKEYYQKHRIAEETRTEYLNRISKPLTQWTNSCKDPVKRARILIHRAVRKNRINKPKSCEECHKPTPAINLHGHHHDYAKWWDVKWLCTFCHKHRHME